MPQASFHQGFETSRHKLVKANSSKAANHGAAATAGSLRLVATAMPEVVPELSITITIIIIIIIIIIIVIVMIVIVMVIWLFVVPPGHPT